MKNEIEFVSILYKSALYNDELELRNRLLRLPLGLDLYNEDLCVEEAQRHYGMLDRNGTLIACALIVGHGNTVKLRQMAVDEKFQGHGIGSQLIDHIECELVPQTARIELNARTSAVNFYKKLQYKEIDSRVFNEVGVAHIKMYRDLL